MWVAESLDRRELKFLVETSQRRRLTAVVHACTAPDPHGDTEGYYPIRSLYYDNEQRDLFWERERNFPSRRKLRVRLYGDAATAASPACFVEIKHKYANRVAKRRLLSDVDEAMAICRGQSPARPLDSNQRRFVDDVTLMVNQRHLDPAILMYYRRQAFRGDERWPDLRVTFDEDLWCRARHFTLRPDDRAFDLPLLAPGWSVLEVKVADSVPRWLAEAIAAERLVLRPHSKYSRAVHAITTGLTNESSWPMPAPVSNGSQQLAAHSANPAPAPVEDKDQWMN